MTLLTGAGCKAPGRGVKYFFLARICWVAQKWPDAVGIAPIAHIGSVRSGHPAMLKVDPRI